MTEQEQQEEFKTAAELAVKNWGAFGIYPIRS
jgi:hypothetical protein